MKAASNNGFTLIELMVVISILAVLASLAAPSMSKLIATQRLRSAAGDMHLALVKARSEAVKRNKDVTISPEGGNWAAGWSILDPEGGAALDVRGPTSSVTVTTSATSVIYRATGRASAAVPKIVFSSPSTDVERCVSADPSGRPYVKEGSEC
jgi:type IV fimbrial biogenesis protein FimT